MKLFYSIHKYDISIFTWLFNVRIHTTLAIICRLISRTGDGQLYVLILAMLFFTIGYQSALFQTIMLGFCIERPVYFVLKNGFKRNSPEAALKDFDSLITPSDQFSFPSGHTSAAFMMATLIGYFFPLLLVALFVWAALIGFSRVVLGVHFPTAILVGVILGVSTAIFSLKYIIE